MQIPLTRHGSLTKNSMKWLLLSLAFVWLVGCVGLSGKNKKARDPFAEHKFSCGEDMPPSNSAAAAAMRGERG